MIAVLVASCSSLEAPIYKGVGAIKVAEVVNDSVVIQANLDFKNPNRIGGTLLLENLHAVVNKIDVGALKSKEVEVPAEKDFLVPLEIKIAYKQILQGKGGLLGALLNSVLKNEVEVALDGKATFRKSFLKKEYPITFSKKIKLVN